MTHAYEWCLEPANVMPLDPTPGTQRSQVSSIYIHRQVTLIQNQNHNAFDICQSSYPGVNLCLDILDISKQNVYIFWNMPYGSTYWMTESRIKEFCRRHLLSLAQYSTQVAQMLIHTFFSHPTCRLKLTGRVKDSWRHIWWTITDTGCMNTGSTGVGVFIAL